MKYLKNIEIAELYKVSPNTVGNWIEAATEQKNSLQIFNDGKRAFILNTTTNHLLLKEMSSRGRKFKNMRSLKVIQPKPEFYKTFSQDQILDIVRSLEVHKEIDMKYSYFNGGANEWHEYMERNIDEGVYKIVKDTLLLNLPYIFELIKPYKQVNIIDIGVGDGLTVKPVIQEFIKRGLLKSYIGIDYSHRMLEIAKNNMKEWFGDNFNFIGLQKDFEYDVFQNIIFNNQYTGVNSEDSINIVFFIGNTIENTKRYSQALQIINYSIGNKDLFLLNQRLDSDKARLSLYFGNNTQAGTDDLGRRKMVLDLLNINEDYYDIERLYSDKDKIRYIRAVLKIDLDIVFETPTFKKVINLASRDQITIWRNGHHSFPDVIQELTKLGFDVMHASTSSDKDQIITISKLKTV